MPTKLRFLGVRFIRKLGKMIDYKVDFAPLSLRDKGGYKMEYMSGLAKRTAHLPGAIVECGLGNGVSFGWLAKVGQESGKKIYGFDSFAGFPKPSVEDTSARAVKEGDWGDAEQKRVEAQVLAQVSREYFDAYVKIAPGFFSDSLKNIPIDQISFLHLDVDLYQSYMDCLVPLYDKVVPGGIIAFDECLNGIEYAKYPGGFKAIVDFFTGKPVDLCRDITSGKYYILKR